ncbi:MAG: hypothetical protein PT119_23840 [Aphanizomenon gracile PMC627.10]|nr:hypothetical protein [Aphanizomenon gracile PMC627.10]
MERFAIPSSDSEALLQAVRSIKISLKKILHGFPQPDYFPPRKFSSGFPINPLSLALLSPGAR